ncbi:hypothetical protein GF360_01205 [candidate division WWE3 bacterium]|nr:hypothetical protein [candidate division WWE3 bacterium]
MRKFFYLGLFIVVTSLNFLLLLLFKDVNSTDNLNYSRKVLDFSREFSVTIDSEFLKKNLKPAYE